MKHRHYSIHISHVGGYTIKEVKALAKKYGYKYKARGNSVYVGQCSYYFDGDWSDKARKDAFETELFARG